MAEFFYFLALLLHCGLFPMSFSDCDRPAPPVVVPHVAPHEAP